MKKASILLLLVFALTSCASSYLKEYENVNKTKNSYDKIIVIGRSSNQVSRLKFENYVVQYLNEQGVDAVASHTVASTKNIQRKFSKSEINAIEKELLEQGINGSIITNFINTQEYKDVIPGTTSTNYYPRRIGRFGRGYAYYPLTTWQPDQILTGVKYLFETSFYKLNQETDDNLQWLGQFEIKDPNNVDKISKAYAKELVEILLKESITQ